MPEPYLHQLYLNARCPPRKLTNPGILALLDDAVCYVDDALHHRPADQPRVQQALDELAQRIAHLDPESTAKRRWFSSRLVCLSLCCQKFADCNSKSLPEERFSCGSGSALNHSVSSRRISAGSAAHAALNRPFRGKQYFDTECFIFARSFSQLVLAPSDRRVSSLVIPASQSRTSS